VLSGGCMYQRLGVRGRVDIGLVRLRRVVNSWRAYVALVAFAFASLLWRQHASLTGALRAVAPNLLHRQHYLGSPRGITWSLAVEEHFYLALPLFLLLATGGWRRVNSIRAVPVTALVLVLACIAMRFLFNWNRPFEMYSHLTPTHLRIDGLFFGVLLAYLYHLKPGFLARIGRHRAVLVVIGIALVLPMGVVLVALCALALLALNFRLYRFFAARRGWWFALRAIPLHWFYYLYSGIAFALGVLLWLTQSQSHERQSIEQR